MEGTRNIPRFSKSGNGLRKEALSSSQQTSHTQDQNSLQTPVFATKSKPPEQLRTPNMSTRRQDFSCSGDAFANQFQFNQSFYNNHTQSGGNPHPHTGENVHQDIDSVSHQTGGNLHSQTGGNLHPQTGGNLHPQTGGNLHPQTGGNLHPQTGGNLHLQTGGNLHLQTGGNLHPQTGGNLHPQTGGNLHPQTGGNLHPQSSGNLHPQTGGNLQPQTGGSLHPQSGGNLHPQSGGNLHPQTGGNLHPHTGGNLHPHTGGNHHPQSAGNHHQNIVSRQVDEFEATHSNFQPIYKCVSCPMFFEHCGEDYKEHLGRHHSIVTGSKGFLLHLKYHGKMEPISGSGRTLVCSFCLKVFQTQAESDKCRDTHKKNKEQKETKCMLAPCAGKIFGNARKLREHELRVHKLAAKTNEKKTYQCPHTFCLKFFSTSGNLKRHLDGCTDKNPDPAMLEKELPPSTASTEMRRMSAIQNNNKNQTTTSFFGPDGMPDSPNYGGPLSHPGTRSPIINTFDKADYSFSMNSGSGNMF